MTTVLFLLALAILLLGPKRAMELSRTAGEWWRKIEAAKAELAAQLDRELNAVDVSPEQPQTDGPQTAAPSIDTAA